MSDVRFFNLSIPAPARLAMMRRAFSEHGAKYPRCPESAKPKTWRDVRCYSLKNWRAAFCEGLHAGQNGSRAIWYSHGGDCFGREEWADKIEGAYIGHTGYYTDCDAYETARGFVVRLSRGRFLAGYHWSDNGERVYFDEVFSSEVTAARWADRCAENFAEESRADSERYSEMSKAENEEEAARDDALHAFQARNVSAWHREEAREKIEALREARETLKEKTEAYEKGA